MVFSSIFITVNGPDKNTEEEHNSIACPTTTNQCNKEYQRMPPSFCTETSNHGVREHSFYHPSQLNPSESEL